MRILTFTSLYPNSAAPNFGVFVENRLRHLVARSGIEATVIAPVPAFPLLGRLSAGYRNNSAVPEVEERHGLRVYHPRAIMPPGTGMHLAPYALYRAGLKVARKLIAEGQDFDVIDAQYFYPDGVAGHWLAQALGKPFVVTARGTDIALLPNYHRPRKLIIESAEAASHIITVSNTLKQRLEALGVTPSKITALRNGVDVDLFTPRDREAARQKFGVSGPTVLSIGNLIPLKGHDLVIRAISEVPKASLLIAGSGPERDSLGELVDKLGLGERVRFLGQVPHADLPSLYNAADVMVLASEREGWANVLLESMACGTPVLASDIPEIAEVVSDTQAGRLVPRTVEDLAADLQKMLAEPLDRASVRAFAERFNWDETSDGQMRIFENVAR